MGDSSYTDGFDPAPSAIEDEYPGWHVWHGVNELWYANYERSSPQIVVCEENTTELREQIRVKQRQIDTRNAWPSGRGV